VMPENEIDLWPPDLGLEGTPQSPVSILRQQANALSSKLNHRIRARVRTEPFARFSSEYKKSGFRLRHTLVLVVPSLEDYELDLLNLVQKEDMYPILAQLKDEDPAPMEGEEELMNWLRDAFASQTTRRALSSLLALV